MKELKKISFAIKFPVFSNYTISVHIVSDINKEFEETGSYVRSVVQAFYVPKQKETKGDIYLQHGVISMEAIVHESYHAIQDMLEKLSLPVTGESVAYPLGYLTHRIVREVLDREIKCR